MTRSEPTTDKDAAPAKPTTRHGFRKDVAALHFPPPEATRPFDKGVGLSGYDRDTGKGVPGEAVLRMPGDEAPRARPFESKRKGAPADAADP